MISKTSLQTILIVVQVTLVFILNASNGTYIDIENGLFVVNTTIYNDTLHVSITAETMGYVAFGVSPEGRMAGSDVVLAGYDAITQTAYIGDHFMAFGPPPMVDAVQNVALISATENGTHTFVSYTRPLDSGDMTEDLPILNQPQFFIWATGSEDAIGRHVAKGDIEVNLFAP